MSALLRIADSSRASRYVRKGPKDDISRRLSLVRLGQRSVFRRVVRKFKYRASLREILLLAQNLEELRRGLPVIGRRRSCRRLKPLHTKLLGDTAQIPSSTGTPEHAMARNVAANEQRDWTPIEPKVSLILLALINAANAAMPGAPVSKRGICRWLPNNA